MCLKIVWEEKYMSKIPSMNIMDIADAIAPGREKDNRIRLVKNYMNK